MGVIQRQSLKFTIINFIGTFIGFLSVIFIYNLEIEVYGYFQLMYSYATLIMPLLGLGIHGAIIKFFPLFKQKNLDQHFLSFTLVIASVSACISVVLIAIIYAVGYPYLFEYFENFQVVDDNKYVILALSFILLYTAIFIFHAMSRYRIVVPDLINNIGLKIFLPITILLVYAKYLDIASFKYVMLAYFVVVCGLLLVYLLTLGNHSLRPRLAALDKGEYKSMADFMGFSILNSLGANIALRLDIVMVGTMINTETAGVYGLILVISNVMDIPTKAINQIGSPVIANDWANNNLSNIQDIYQKSSIYGSIIGVFLFLLLYFIWPDILALMPKGKMDITVALAMSIFGFLGLSKLFDLVTGVNSIIISYSKSYRYHMYFLVALAAVNLSLNYFLLLRFGVVGAAMATCISILLYNIAKHIFVRYTFDLRLAVKDQSFIMLAGLAVFGIMYFVPSILHPVVSMMIKGAIIFVLFATMMWLFNPGEELRKVLKDTWSQVPFLKVKKTNP